MTGKCKHIAAIMYMVMYMSLDKKPKLFQSTTDVKSYWRGPGNQTNKNPKPVGVNNYEKKFRNDRYKDIDPRPVNLQGPKLDKMDAFLGKNQDLINRADLGCTLDSSQGKWGWSSSSQPLMALVCSALRSSGGKCGGSKCGGGDRGSKEPERPRHTMLECGVCYTDDNIVVMTTSP